MKPLLRDYLYFSKAQKRGISLLLLLLLSTIAAREYLQKSSEKEIQYQLSLVPTAIEVSGERTSVVDQSELQEKYEEQLFPFDPNHIELSEWVQLGLSEKQALSILKYREKGGFFKQKSDLKKMYTISDEKYQQLQPYILLPDTMVEEERLMTDKVNNRHLLVEINTADSMDLIRLKGIGPVYSSRIIKYRNLLGGFYELDQLKEVWGLSDSTLGQIRSQLSIDKTYVKKLDLKAANKDELAAHPYIKWKLARSIIAYRNQHGDFDSIEEIKNIYSINDSLYNRIFPYLAIPKKAP